MNCLQTELTITGNVYLGCCPKFLPARQILSKSPSLLAWSPSKAQRRNAGVEEGPWALRGETQARKSQICSGEVSGDPGAKSRRDAGTPEGSLKPPCPGLFPAGHQPRLCCAAFQAFGEDTAQPMSSGCPGFPPCMRSLPSIPGSLHIAWVVALMLVVTPLKAPPAKSIFNTLMPESEDKNKPGGGRLDKITSIVICSWRNAGVGIRSG